MATKLTRREVLISSLGAAALAAGRLGPDIGGRTGRCRRPADRSRPRQLARGHPAFTSYEPQLLRTTIQNAFDLIGGIQKLVSNKTVTIKINVTGRAGHAGGLPGYRTYQIHPNVLAAVCGGDPRRRHKRIIVVESQYLAARRPRKSSAAPVGT